MSTTSQVNTEHPRSQVTSAVEKPELTVLLSAVELAAAQKQADEETLPATLKEALALLAQLNDKRFKGRELEEKKPFFRRLKSHLAKLQQGLPVVPPNANDHAASYAARDAAVRDYRLAQLARTNPEVKAIIEERDTLKKSAGSDEQLKKDLEAARAQITVLTEEKAALTEANTTLNATLKQSALDIAAANEALAAMTVERDALAAQPKVFDPASETLGLVISAVREAKSLKEAREKVAELTAPPSEPPVATTTE